MLSLATSRRSTTTGVILVVRLAIVVIIGIRVIIAITAARTSIITISIVSS
jgi:hypothetical protein